MKKVFSLFLVMVMILSFSVVSMAEDEVTITIVHTNDTHGRIVEDSYNGNMGFAKIATYVNMLREENPELLLIDAGDAFHGQTIAQLVRGESVAKVMNVMGYDVMAPGNHDFNYGYERLLELEDMIEFPILAGNIEMEDGTQLLNSYVIKEVQGLKIGMFGLATPETEYKTHPNNVKGLDFTSPIEAAKMMVEELRDQVDVLIAIGHIGEDAGSEFTSHKILAEVEGIDLFVDGHSHTAKPEGEMVGNTLLVQAGEYDENLGIVELVVTGGEITSKTARLLSYEESAEIEEDAEVKAAIDDIKAANDLITGVELGSTPVNLDGERGMVRTTDTNLSNLIADAMLYETGADVALTNGGGIRASIEAGTVTVGDVITVLPFGNYIVTVEVTGADIVAALENGLTDYPATKGAFPQVGGMTYTFDPNLPAFERVTEVLIDGMPVDLEASYVLATNDFMAAGGDEFTMLNQEVVGMYAGLDEALINYMEVAELDNLPEPNRSNALPIEEVEEVTYTVVAGDVLWKIAQKFETTWQAIAELNELSNPNLIFPGDVFVIPQP